MTLVDTIPITSPRDVARRAVATVSASHNDLKALETVIFELCLNVKQWAEADGNVFVEGEENRSAGWDKYLWIRLDNSV